MFKIVNLQQRCGTSFNDKDGSAVVSLDAAREVKRIGSERQAHSWKQLDAYRIFSETVDDLITGLSLLLYSYFVSSILITLRSSPQQIILPKGMII